MHSGMMDRILSMVFPYVDMMPVGWYRLRPVWGLSLLEISINDC